MRLILLLPFLIAANKGIAQKIPSKATMQKQMQEAMKEIDELAKDDPEMAKAVKQMMMPGAKQAATQAPPKPVFHSPITLVNLKQVPVRPTAAQAKDKLLWYTGKKINPNTLITTSGTIVQYQAAKSRLVIQPGNDQLAPLVKELAKTEQRKNEFITAWSAQKNSYFYYPQLTEALKEYDHIGSLFAGVLKNTIDFASNATNRSLHQKGGTKALVNPIYTSAEEINLLHQQIMDLAKTPPPLTVPAIPVSDFSLCGVRKKNKDAYEEKVREFLDGWNQYERSIIEKVMEIHHLEEIDRMNGIELPATIDQINSDIEPVMKLATSRTKQKIDLLEERYAKDFVRLPVLTSILIGMERQNQLLSTEETTGFMEKLAGLFPQFDDFVNDQMNKLNYNVLFNFSFIIGMERQKQLLGSQEETENYPERLNAFNRFRIELEMEYDSKKQDECTLETSSGKLASNKDQFVKVAMLNDSVFTIRPFDVDYQQDNQKKLNISMHVAGGNYLKQHTCDPSETICSSEASRQGDIICFFPSIKFDFCSDHTDTAIVHIPMDLAPVIPKGCQFTPLQLISYLSQLVIDRDKSVQNEGKEKEVALNLMKGLTSGSSTSTGYPKLDEAAANFEKLQSIVEGQAQLATLSEQQQMSILFNAYNNASVLINAVTTTAHALSGGTASADDRISGNVRIRIVHDPLPYDRPVRKPLQK